MILFLDTEFSELSQNAELISLALIGTNIKPLYIIFTDYDTSTANEWVKENVISNIKLNREKVDHQFFEGNKNEVKKFLIEWFSDINVDVQIWADVPHYDWVLFCGIFGSAFDIPNNIHYMPMDLATLLQVKGINIDQPRIQLIDKIDIPKFYKPHNAFWDAFIGMRLLQKLNNE